MHAQLDSFNKAATGRSGKFTRLFSGRRGSPPKTPQNGSPAKSDPPATPSTQPSLSLDDMLIYQQARSSAGPPRGMSNPLATPAHAGMPVQAHKALSVARLQPRCSC